MGLPMVRNLLKAGFTVRTFDLSADAMAATERDGAKPAPTMREAVADVDCVFTMLPMGHDVEAVFRGDEGLMAVTRPGALLVDSSTISSAISRALSVEAKASRAPHARCAGLRRDAWRACRDPHIHGGRRRSRCRAHPSRARGDGEAHRPCRPAWGGPYGKALQQHAVGRLHDRDHGGAGAGRGEWHRPDRALGGFAHEFRRQLRVGEIQPLSRHHAQRAVLERVTRADFARTSSSRTCGSPSSWPPR